MDADMARHMELFPEEYAQPSRPMTSSASGRGAGLDSGWGGLPSPSGQQLTRGDSMASRDSGGLLAERDLLQFWGDGCSTATESERGDEMEGRASPSLRGREGGADGSSRAVRRSSVQAAGGVHMERPMRVPAIPPPTAAYQTAAGVTVAAAAAADAAAGVGGNTGAPEPFHNCGGGTLFLDMMVSAHVQLVFCGTTCE